MNKLITISIGIPAYNEEANIGQLLHLILSQKGGNFILQKIFVLSDGSSDNTANEVAAVGSNKIYFRDDKRRIGKSARLDEIFRLNRSDVLLLMDADVIIKDHYLFSKLINRVDFEKTGIAAIKALPLPPRTFIERCLDASAYTTERIAQNWNNGDNYLSFKGCFLALSEKFVKSLSMPGKLINNDAYLYFAAKKQGLPTAYVKDCKVYFKSPHTISDHMKQSSRFQVSKKELHRYFSPEILNYSLPKRVVLKSMGQTFTKKPIYLISYLVIRVISRLRRQKGINSTWSIAGSTKQKIALTH